MKHNYSFTSEVRYWFEYDGGETLEFIGDDDVWVFVNGQLAVDLGGIHSASSGSVTLDAAARDAVRADASAASTRSPCSRPSAACAARRTS